MSQRLRFRRGLASPRAPPTACRPQAVGVPSLRQSAATSRASALVLIRAAERAAFVVSALATPGYSATSTRPLLEGGCTRRATFALSALAVPGYPAACTRPPPTSGRTRRAAFASPPRISRGDRSTAYYPIASAGVRRVGGSPADCVGYSEPAAAVSPGWVVARGDGPCASHVAPEDRESQGGGGRLAHSPAPPRRSHCSTAVGLSVRFGCFVSLPPSPCNPFTLQPLHLATPSPCNPFTLQPHSLPFGAAFICPLPPPTAPGLLRRLRMPWSALRGHVQQRGGHGGPSNAVGGQRCRPLGSHWRWRRCTLMVAPSATPFSSGRHGVCGQRHHRLGLRLQWRGCTVQTALSGAPSRSGQR